MQVARGAKAEPGVAAIVKGFGNGIEVNDVSIKMGASFQIKDRESNMIDSWRSCLRFCIE